METALAVVGESAHAVLIDPPSGISNVTEWAKKQACWARVQSLPVGLPQAFLDGLVSGEEKRDTDRAARREQRQLNSVETQIAVMSAGPAFWADVLAWGSERKLLSDTDTGVLRVVAGNTGRIPSDRQCARAAETLERLRAEGYPGRIGTCIVKGRRSECLKHRASVRS